MILHNEQYTGCPILQQSYNYGLIMAYFAGQKDRMKNYGVGIVSFGVLAVMLASTGLFPVYLVLMVVY